MQTSPIFKANKRIAFVLLTTLFAVNTAIAQDYTICSGESIEVGPFSDPPTAPDEPPSPEGSGYYDLPGCIGINRNISPLDGVITKN